VSLQGPVYRPGRPQGRRSANAKRKTVPPGHPAQWPRDALPMAGLLACGSSHPPGLPSFPVAMMGIARRLQLRGQPRLRAVTSPCPRSLFTPCYGGTIDRTVIRRYRPAIKLRPRTAWHIGSGRIPYSEDKIRMVRRD